MKTDKPMDKQQVASLCKALKRNKLLNGLYLRSTNTPHKSMQIECLYVMNGTMIDCAEVTELEVTTWHQLLTWLKLTQDWQHLTCAVCWHLTTAFVVMNWLDLCHVVLVSVDR